MNAPARSFRSAVARCCSFCFSRHAGGIHEAHVPGQDREPLPSKSRSFDLWRSPLTPLFVRAHGPAAVAKCVEKSVFLLRSFLHISHIWQKYNSDYKKLCYSIGDLKSLGSNFPCRFKSGRPHQNFNRAKPKSQTERRWSPASRLGLLMKSLRCPNAQFL
jgi:hypothetical protein